MVLFYEIISWIWKYFVNIIFPTVNVIKSIDRFIAISSPKKMKMIFSNLINEPESMNLILKYKHFEDITLKLIDYQIWWTWMSSFCRSKIIQLEC